MKKLLIPAVLAVVLGLGAGSAFSYKNAKEAAKVFAAHVADSVAKHVKDSTTAADSVAKDEQARELAAAGGFDGAPWSAVAAGARDVLEAGASCFGSVAFGKPFVAALKVVG